MRVVVIGATGNVGTALLRRLHAAAEVTEIIGVARRMPDASVEPYRDVRWHSVDIGPPSASVELERAFAGADAVVHLAWALQPNHDEQRMWRTNVTGTAHVLAAAAAAGVGQVVYASSVGAYSPSRKNVRQGEDWPTGGLHTSHYSRQKALNERALEAFEAAHPDIVVTRMRPGLVLQRNAGAELAALFLGPLVPTGWLNHVRPPVLPLPQQLISQAVHAVDVADAFWRAIDRRAPGAFNVAAEPVLTPERIGSVVGARRVIPMRLRVLRSLVWVTWKLRIQRADPGWLDIATNVPIMSTDRAREVLGWAPTVSSTDALAEVLDGLADRARVPQSPQLRA